MEFQSLETIILRKLSFKQIEDKLNKSIEKFNKYRLNNDFEYEWKKRGNGWVVDCSTDITCWDCISQAKHFLLDDRGYLEEAYCDICILDDGCYLEEEYCDICVLDDGA